MKKQVTLTALLLLGACTVLSPEPQVRYVIDTPYGQQEVYDDMIIPDVYAIAATRATNRMLDQTAEIFEQNPAPRLYIKEVKKESESLPDGFYYAKEVTKSIIEGSRTFTRVNNMNDADYNLEITVRELADPNRDTPVIEYKSTLFDKNNAKINEWVETIRQIQNDDRSWW